MLALLQGQRMVAGASRGPVLADLLVGIGQAAMELRLVRQQADGAPVMRDREVVGSLLHEVLPHQELRKSGERRVGQECGSTCGYRGSPTHEIKNHTS